MQSASVREAYFLKVFDMFPTSFPKNLIFAAALLRAGMHEKNQLSSKL
jgi:hypothetical protein